MNVRFRTRAPVVLVLVLAGSGMAAEAAEVHCERGDLVRRVELRDQPSESTACQVVYWKDTEAPGVERVLWRAQRDRGFCETKARELVQRLSSAGWSCVDATAAPATAARARPPEPPQPRPAPKPRVASDTPRPVSRPEPTEVVAPEPAAGPASGSFRAEQLNATVARTLASIRELYGADPRADQARYGDLDGDGIDDAAVMITYQAVDEGPMQFVVAYRFDGTAYRSAATKKVSGRFLPAVSAEIAAVTDGAVLVDLQEAESGVCCRVRRTAFVLRDDSLAEVEPPPLASTTAQPTTSAQ